MRESRCMGALWAPWSFEQHQSSAAAFVGVAVLSAQLVLGVTFTHVDVCGN